MSNRLKANILYAVGLIFCVLPAFFATVEYFPIWQEKSPQTMFSGLCVSGISVFILVLVAVPPVLRAVKQRIRKTPAAWVGFLIAAAVFKLISSIIDALFVITVIAALGNLCGAFFFRLSARYRKEYEREKVTGNEL